MPIAVQIATAGDCAHQPAAWSDRIRDWGEAALHLGDYSHRSLTIRVVGADEMQQLNGQFRGLDQTTNVLAFPFSPPDQIDTDYLGDVIICWSVVQHEARHQARTVETHFAHMVVHGILHLCGFDHKTDAQTRTMTTLESALLQQFSLQ